MGATEHRARPTLNHYTDSAITHARANLRLSSTLSILGKLDVKYLWKNVRVTKRSTKTAKLLDYKTKAIYGISRSHPVRVTLHHGRSWVIGETSY